MSSPQKPKESRRLIKTVTTTTTVVQYYYDGDYMTAGDSKDEGEGDNVPTPRPSAGPLVGEPTLRPRYPPPSPSLGAATPPPLDSSLLVPSSAPSEAEVSPSTSRYLTPTLSLPPSVRGGSLVLPSPSPHNVTKDIDRPHDRKRRRSSSPSSSPKPEPGL